MYDLATDPGELHDLAEAFDGKLYGEHSQERSREQQSNVDLAVLETYTGTYQITTLGKTLIVKLEEGQLLMTDDEVQWTPLLAETETRFFVA